MGRKSKLRQQRLSPPRSVALTKEAITTYLSRDQQREVVTLLRYGPQHWERRYQPTPAHSATVAQVVLRCAGEAASIELIPHTTEIP